MGYWSPEFDDAYEEFGTRQENWDGNSSTASVVLRVKWEDRFDYIEDMMLNSREYPEQSDLICWSASLTGTKAKYENPPSDDDQEAIEPEEALIRFSYKSAVGGGVTGISVDPETGDDVEVTDSITPAFEYITVGGKTLEKPPVGNLTKYRALEPGQEPSVLERRYAFSRQISNLTYIKPAVLNLYGTVNQQQLGSTLLGKPANFPSPGDDAEPLLFKPETLLLNGVSIQYDANRGKFAVNIQYDWKQIDNHLYFFPLLTNADRYCGHNHFYDPEAQVYVRLQRKSTEDGSRDEFNPYPVADGHHLILFPATKTN